MAKKKYYAVRKGLTPGIYFSWNDCKKQTSGFPDAQYKGFATMEEAESFITGEESRENIINKPTPETIEIPYMGEGQAIAYVDGSYNNTSGEYGCGVVFFFDGKAEFISEKGNDEYDAEMRNVAGELLGAKKAMERAVCLNAKKLTLYHDYQGIASWCLGDWKTNKEGTIAYKLFYVSVCHVLDITFVKVKGHSGDVYNDLADELARESLKLK